MTEGLGVIIRGMAEVITCADCHELFDDGRFLECTHCFCLKCLQKYQTSDVEMKCPLPTCSAITVPVTKHLVDLQRNLAVEELVEILNKHKSIKRRNDKIVVVETEFLPTKRSRYGYGMGSFGSQRFMEARSARDREMDMPMPPPPKPTPEEEAATPQMILKDLLGAARGNGPPDPKAEQATLALAESFMKTFYKGLDEDDDTTHRNVQCDNCEHGHFRDVRFKCGNCEDYDLCEGCEEKPRGEVHDPTHLFIRLKKPQNTPVEHDGKIFIQKIADFIKALSSAAAAENTSMEASGDDSPSAAATPSDAAEPPSVAATPPIAAAAPPGVAAATPATENLPDGAFAGVFMDAGESDGPADTVPAGILGDSSMEAPGADSSYAAGDAQSADTPSDVTSTCDGSAGDAAAPTAAAPVADVPAATPSDATIDVGGTSDDMMDTENAGLIIRCHNCNRDKEYLGDALFKCGICEDYILCENCEDFSPLFHSPEHPFVKVPMDHAIVDMLEKERMIQAEFYKEVEKADSKEGGSGEQPSGGK